MQDIKRLFQNPSSMILINYLADSSKMSLCLLHTSECSYDSLTCLLGENAYCKKQLFVLLLPELYLSLKGFKN